MNHTHGQNHACVLPHAFLFCYDKDCFKICPVYDLSWPVKIAFILAHLVQTKFYFDKIGYFKMQPSICILYCLYILKFAISVFKVFLLRVENRARSFQTQRTPTQQLDFR